MDRRHRWNPRGNVHDQVYGPEETYTIKCTDDVSVTDCLSTNGTVQETGIARGAQAGTLTGLTDGDEYKCWVIAVNSVDSVCSAPVQYTLPSVDSVCSAPVQYTLPVRGYFSGALCASTPRLESHLTMIGHLCSCFTSPTTASPCSVPRLQWATLVR